MRQIDYFDQGADLYPRHDCRHDGARGWTYAEVSAVGEVLKKDLRAPYWAGRERKI
jgi:hypothetical protein